MSDLRFVNGVPLVCPSCEENEFQIAGYATAVVYTIVNPLRAWDEAVRETGPEINDSYDNEGNEWECRHCGCLATDELSQALDRYIELHEIGPEAAAKAIVDDALTREEHP
jgi:hypothetical protein